MIPEHELKAEEVHQMLFKTMQTHLSLKTEGWRCTTEQTLNSLMKVVAEGSSLEAVCADTSEGVDSNTLREQLNAALDVAQLRQQEAEMNAALAAAIPRGMPRGGLEVAIDTHDEPFEDDLPGVVERLLQRLGHLGLHATVLYLDKGFSANFLTFDNGVCKSL